MIETLKNDIKLVFGKNLKYYRIEKNLTQMEFAELADISVKTLSDIERGIYGTSLERVAIFAKILKIEPYLLIKYDEEHFKTPDRLDKHTGTRRKRTKY